MRSRVGIASVTCLALLLGVLVVSQFRSRETFARSLERETPESLTTLIADLNDRNAALRGEIFDLRLQVERAQGSVEGGQGSLEALQHQLADLRVFSARSEVTGPGISVRIAGQFDERALSDLVNELRNAGAEAIAVNDVRVGPRAWFGSGAPGSLVVSGASVPGPWTVRAIGDTEVLYVAMTRTGGIVGQFAVIYRGTAFSVVREAALDLPALSSP